MPFLLLALVLLSASLIASSLNSFVYRFRGVPIASSVFFNLSPFPIIHL
jgi:hypothetical protein